MVRIVALSILAASQPTTLTRDSQDHALILAETAAEKEFIPEAARLADTENLKPVSLDEINAFLERERIKDLHECVDVACYSDFAGAFDIEYAIRITSIEASNRANLSLYSLFPRPQKLKDWVVSHETARERLLRSLAEFRQRRDALADLLTKIPCGFPWPKLRAAIGKPDLEIMYQPGFGGPMFEYLDFLITVADGEVRDIQGQFGKGPSLLECNRAQSSRLRW
jgi:hypothetical protein